MKCLDKRIAPLIFLLAFLLRLVMGWAALRAPALASGPDAIGYHELAAALWEGRFPSLFRTPGYPLVLALTGATTSDRIVFALLLQMLLDALTAVLVSALAWRWWQSETTALVAGLLYAFCPVAVTNAWLIGTEPQAVFLVVVGLWLMSRKGFWGNVWLQTSCWFVATMTRPSYALLPVVASVFLLWQRRLSLSWKRQVLVLIGYGLLTGAWLSFNYARAGMPVLSSNPEVSFYIYDTAALRMAERMTMIGYMRIALLNPPEFDRQMRFYQLSYASEEQASLNTAATDLWFTKDNPALIQKLRAEALQKTQGKLPLLTGIHLTGVLQSLRPMWNSADWFFRVLDGLRMLLLPLAVLVLLWQRQWWWLAFFGIWAVYALLPPGPVGAWRFRALIEPFVSLTLAFVAFVLVQRMRGLATAFSPRLQSRTGAPREATVIGK